MDMNYKLSWRNISRCFLPLTCVLLAACLALSGCSPQAREARYLASGQRMMKTKDYARAVIQFSNAAKTMPRDAEPVYQLGMAYLAQGNLEMALGSFQKAVSLNAKHQQAQLQLARLLALSSKKQAVTQAQQTVQELIGSGQVSAEALDTLALTELKLGNPQDAEKHLEQAVAKFPNDLAAAVQLARIKLFQKDMAGADEILKKLAAQQPPSANAFLALAQHYLITNRPTDAEAQLRRALDVDPKSAAALLSLGSLLVRSRRLDPADQIYARISALPDPKYRFYHAAFLAFRGNHAHAIQEAEKLYQQHPDERTTRTLLVQEYLRTRRPVAAEQLLTAALQHNSNDFEARLQRSAIYLSSGRPDDAQKDVTAALHFRPDSPEAHFLLAAVYEAHRDVSNQRQELAEALRLRPDYLVARLQLARLLMNLGSTQAALDVLDATIRTSPTPRGQEFDAYNKYRNNLSYLVERNWALIVLGRNDEARQEVDRGLGAVKSPDLLLQDAYLRLRQKDYSSARASLVEALNRNPGDLRCLRLIVDSYVAQKQPDQAVRMVRDYAAQHDKFAPVQVFLAQLFMADHKPSEARAALMTAKKADPNFVQADLALAQLDVSEGRANQASTDLAAIVNRDPRNVAARLMLAGVEDSRGNHTSAVEAYRKVLEVQPASVMALNNLAFDLAEYANQTDEALKLAQKAMDLAPNAPVVENTLGWVLYRKGLYSVALPYLEKAADKDPTARHKCHLAMAYLKMGDQERGQKNLMAAIKLDPNLPEIRTAQQMLDDLH